MSAACWSTRPGSGPAGPAAGHGPARSRPPSIAVAAVRAGGVRAASAPGRSRSGWSRCASPPAPRCRCSRRSTASVGPGRRERRGRVLAELRGRPRPSLLLVDGGAARRRATATRAPPTEWWLYTGRAVRGGVRDRGAPAVVRTVGVLVVTLATVAGQVVGAVLLDAARAGRRPVAAARSRCVGAVATRGRRACWLYGQGRARLGGADGRSGAPRGTACELAVRAGVRRGRWSGSPCRARWTGSGAARWSWRRAVLLGRLAARRCCPSEQLGLLRVRGRAFDVVDAAGARAGLVGGRAGGPPALVTGADRYGDPGCLDAEIPHRGRRRARSQAHGRAQRQGHRRRRRVLRVDDRAAAGGVRRLRDGRAHRHRRGQARGPGARPEPVPPDRGLRDPVVGADHDRRRRRATRRPPARTSWSSPPACRASPA